MLVTLWGDCYPSWWLDALAAGDPRLSIQERYSDHATYVNLVTAAAEKLESERLVLDSDVQAYITAAQAASVP